MLFLLFQLFVLSSATLRSSHRHRDGNGNLASCGRVVNITAVASLVSEENLRLKPRALLFGLFSRGEPLLVTAFGSSTPSQPATSLDHFRIGGITEPMLSTLYFVLLERGLVDPTQKLGAYFPGVLMADVVTLGMLAANTAGYIDYARTEAFRIAQGSNPLRDLSALELVGFATVNGTMSFPPGTNQNYSHTDMLLLHLMIEKQTSQSIADLYAKYVFLPLGLADSRSPAPFDNQITPAPVLHSYQSTDTNATLGDATNWSTSWFQGYGIITSTLRDLGVWGNAFCSHSLISAQSFKTQTEYQGFGKVDPRFGYGVIVSNGWLFQNPSLNGYYGAWACNPKSGLTVVAVSTLAENTSTSVGNVAFAVLEAVVKLLSPNSFIELPA